MNVRVITTTAEDIASLVKTQSALGYGLVSIYVTEPYGMELRTMEMIMASDTEVIRISSVLDKMEFLSFTPFIPSAGIYEREIFEMSGVNPINNEDMRLLKIRKVYDDHYPMQKDGEKGAFREIPIPMNDMIGEGIFEIPVGPIHAGVIEPGHFRFSAAGEPILMMHTYLGYKYRGMEKLFETSVEKNNTRLAERISGDNAIAHSLAYLQALESNVEIPLRAQYIRTLYAELERIYYLLSGMSGIALDTALVVPAAEGYAIKERMLRLNHRVSGHRMLRGVFRPGGVRYDIDKSTVETIESSMIHLKLDLESLFETIMSSASFLDRAENTGVLTNELATKLRTVGPIARASGVKYDVRKNHPYAAYNKIKMRVPVEMGGDVAARFKVRKEEISESISIITQCIENMEPGELFCDVITDDGVHIGMTESPRGEILHCMHVMNGNIWRYKIRDASFPNWPAIEHAVLGNIVPDFPVINKSFDLSYSGNDL